jgi:hypothetical protein
MLFFKAKRIRQVLPALSKTLISGGLSIPKLFFRPADDGVQHTSVQSKDAHNVFAQASAIKGSVERFRRLLILDFLNSLGPN